MITYTIQGFDLHQPEIGFQLMETSSFASSISPNRINLRIPRMHGQVPLWNDELTETKILFRVRIRDEDPTQLQYKWEHLRRLMWTGSNQGITVRRESGVSPTPQVTSTFAQLETMSEPDFWCAAGIVDTDIILNIPSGRWQSIETFDYTFNNYSSPQNIAFVNESTAPNDNFVARIAGPFNTTGAWVRIFDEVSRTGIQIQPNEIVAAGQWLIYERATNRMWRNNNDDFDARQALMRPVIRTLRGGPVTLVPEPSFTLGSSISAVRMSRSVNANTTITTIRGRRTYI